MHCLKQLSSEILGMKGNTRYKKIDTHIRNTINLVTLVMGGKFGSKILINPLGNKLDLI
jgi:hypothetical protein